jgi:hypothetical protein
MTLLSPQLVLSAQMLRFWYVPAEPDAVDALVPQPLVPLANSQVFLNQYVVRTDEQTSGLGRYELTYLGANVQHHDVGGSPAHWLIHYYNSDAAMRDYVRTHGFPAGPGRTRLNLLGPDTLEAVTEVHGTPIVRSVVTFTPTTGLQRGQLGYIGHSARGFFMNRFPYVAETRPVATVQQLEFLDPSHPSYRLRPSPDGIVRTFLSFNMSFCYPGGEETIPDP